MIKSNFTKSLLAFISFLLLYITSAERTMAAITVDVEQSFVEWNFHNSDHPLVDAPLTAPSPVVNNFTGTGNGTVFSQKLSAQLLYSLHFNKSFYIFYLKDAVNRTQYLPPLHLTFCVFRI